MKKLNKLFAILIAVLGVQTLQAQTDVTSTYLTNAGFDDGTNNWTYGGNGTHYGGVAAYGSSTAYNSVTNVSVDKFGKSEGNALHTSAGWGSPSIYTQEVTFPAGDYKITFDVINRNSSATKITNRFGWVPNSGNPVYSSATDIIFNMWQTISVTFTLSTQTTGKISVGMVSTSGSGSGAVAKLFTDNVRIFKMDEASDPTIANPIDYSDLINQSTWWYDEDDNEPGSASSLTTNVTKGEWPYRMAERYRGVGGHYGKKLYQTISVPAGVYQVQAACMSAHANGVEGGNALTDGTLNNAYFYANEEEVTYPLANATSSFQKHIVTLTEDGTIEFGIKTVAVGANWNAIGCATVIKVANSYEEYLEDLLGESYTERQTLIGKLEALQSKLPEPYYNNTVSPAIASANEANTQETLSAANNILKGILTNAESMVEPYAKLANLIALCTEYTDEQNSNANSDDVLSTFNTAINTATTAADEATTADALNTAFNALESARQTYAQNAVPVYPYPFDMTFLLPNTTFDKNIDGWTKSGGAKWMDAGNVECYNTTFEFSMEYTGLNSGSWEIQVDAFYRYGGYNDAETAHNNSTEELHATLYANNNTVAVKSIMEGADKAGSIGATTTDGVRVPNAPGDCDTYFATGCYTNAIATVIADGKLKVGIKKEETQQYDWTIFDNFKLIYKGIDVTDLQNALSALITTSDVIKDEKMGAAESATLSTALDNADATVTNADRLSEMISNLQSAYDNAAASISTYAAVSAYIAKANKINESIAASYQAQYDNGTIEGDAETVRQALNVATFNYVEEVFGNEIVLTDWGAASNAMWSASGEHWDGTTGEGATSYYDANGTNTTHTLSKTVELTPGTYIFRGAGRSNTNTTLTLSIDIDGIEPVVFNPKGNTGRGIDKEGNATFADDAEYARNGQGQGWEWEFIKFTLKETTTVTLTATCKTSGSGWASFANNGLRMDNDTYVVANAGAITAPKAEADALVDTKPMGTAENDALKNAIAQANETLNTPEKLNAAIEALETAVANANAWLIAYNEAKAPLVAALERFETDFNDGANGALRFIVGWSDLLEAVAEAAVAKDAFNNYEGFTEAAAALNIAMDAVYGDYLKYGMLEDCTELIGGADCAANDPSWPGSGRTTATAQHWSGIEKIYFAQNHENGAAREQTVTLPKSGTYLLKAAVRAVEAASYVDIIINGKSHKIMGAHGRTGGTIATDGTEWESVAAGIEAGKTFANGGKGYGWVYQYIYFNAEAGETSIGISLSNINNNREANCGGMELYYLRPNYTIEEGNIVKHYGIYTETFATVHTTHDVTNATMSNLAVDVTAVPNALIIANEGQVSNANNVIVDGTAASLVLNDGGYAFNATADFTATALNYAREFTKDTWLTVCLPFAYTIPENVKVETLGAIDLDTKTFTFDEVTGTMEANTPYLIKNSTETAALFAPFSNVVVEATPAAMNVTITADNSEHEGEFIGTYTTVKTDALMEDGSYDILFFGTDGQLYYLSQGITTKVVKIKPFRAYIRLPKGTINWSDGQQARVRHRNSEMTDIDTLESADDSQKTTVIYDMHGRRVTEMVKGGMYIVNGKKVIVK